MNGLRRYWVFSASTRTKSPRVTGAWLAGLLVAVTGCSGVDASGDPPDHRVDAGRQGAQDTSDWIMTTLTDDLDSFGRVMTTAGNRRGWTKGSCAAVGRWVNAVDEHPRPEDENAAKAWDDLLAAVDAFAGDPCLGDMKRVNEGMSEIHDASLALMKVDYDL